MSGVYRDLAAALLAVDRDHRPVNVGLAAQLACLLEASAPKPGNVSPGRHFSDLRYEDFLASALAIGEPMARAGEQSVGATIRKAIEATAQWSPSNTNLGIVLLFAPLARAAVNDPGGDVHALSRKSPPGSLQGAVRRVLDGTTIDDARDVYAAIRIARPGGLGRADEQDVASEPTMRLVEVMRLAAHRDTIASEYVTGFEITFGTAVPALERARHDGLRWDDAIVETFLTVLSQVTDTHIARRSGKELADEVTARAQRVLADGGVRSDAGRRAIDDMDRALRDERNSGNPGTTADLTAAAIFVLLLGGEWVRLKADTTGT
ncbi:MAG TPA: triphosphoribosyl-dephospho-CoA synthase [Vicinamibacterales bacterium]|nr:triphosphoribosyl-dephospho-CoA synthase [Vicinamibacterales bacterium]